MGRGNWYPGSDLSACRVVYVALPEPAGPDESAYERAVAVMDDFYSRLDELLPRSFYTPSRPYYNWRHDLTRYEGRDTICIAYNGLFAVFLDSQGDIDHLGLAVKPREGAPAFAEAGLDSLADKLFDGLQEHYALRVRTSAWTTAPRRLAGLTENQAGKGHS